MNTRNNGLLPMPQMPTSQPNPSVTRSPLDFLRMVVGGAPSGSLMPQQQNKQVRQQPMPVEQTPTPTAQQMPEGRMATAQPSLQEIMFQLHQMLQKKKEADLQAQIAESGFNLASPSSYGFKPLSL